MANETGWEDFSAWDRTKTPKKVEESPFKDNVPPPFSNAQQLIVGSKGEMSDFDGKVFFELEEKVLELDEPVPLDRQGICPTCKENWDGGDVEENLLKIEVLRVSLATNKVAALYGHGEFSKIRFSKLKTIELEDRILCQCPKCAHVYDSKTSQHFTSIYEANKV